MGNPYLYLYKYTGSIMCKHDVISIQQAHCGLVGPDCNKSRASAACNGYYYAPIPTLRTCEPRSLSLAATSSSQLAYLQR